MGAGSQNQDTVQLVTVSNVIGAKSLGAVCGVQWWRRDA